MGNPSRAGNPAPIGRAQQVKQSNIAGSGVRAGDPNAQMPPDSKLDCCKCRVPGSATEFGKRRSTKLGRHFRAPKKPFGSVAMVKNGKSGPV